MEAGTAAAAQRVGHDKEGGGFHFRGQNAQALPGFPFLEQLIGNGHFSRAVLAIESVLALHNAHMSAFAHGDSCLTQGDGHIQIGNGGVFDGRVFHRGMLKADGAGGNDDIAGLHIQLDAAAGADTNKGIRADVVQFFHGDGRGRTADTGGADADLFAQQGAGVDIILTVLRHMHGIVKELGNGLAAARIAGQNAVAAHVALDAMDMELFFKLLHDKTLLVRFGTL